MNEDELLDLDTITPRPVWQLIDHGVVLDTCQADTIGRAIETLCPVEVASSRWSALTIDMKLGPATIAKLICTDGTLYIRQADLR